MMKLKLLFLTVCMVLTGLVHGQFSTVGIIGTATPEGWDASTPMVQDVEDPDLWTISVELVDGELKFRADDDWAVNWGGIDLPIGAGEQDGPNFQIIGGNYEITFNSATGDYFFDYAGTIGIIGDATRFEWDRDVFLFPDRDNPGLFFGTMPLNAGDAKFRKDGDWTVNWGSDEFPAGIAVQDGPNIPIEMAGTYRITFDTTSGEYLFDEVVGFDSLSIIGSATPGGWDEDTHLQRDAGNPDVWRTTVFLVEGELKFRAENDWAINWGGETFPTGIAVPNGDDIVVDQEGDYLVTFNVATLEYSFLIIEDFDVVSIIGDATPGGWDDDTDMEKDTEDGSVWRLRVVLNDGEMKFRANNEWTINWGGPDFPTGVATQDGVNIPVVGGEYRITFNSTTGEYHFDEIIEFNSISIVGRSGPFGEWPDENDGGAVDWFMDKDPNDGNLWNTAGVQLFDFDPDDDGGIKFRADTAWTVNWGAADFPEGVGTQDGPNIEPTAGLYDVFFNAATGEYVFSPSTSTGEIYISPEQVSLYPNPAGNEVHIDLRDIEPGGKLVVRIFDMTGKEVLSSVFADAGQIALNVSDLTSGMYIVNITDGSFFIGKRLSISR
ncbi:MAG: SusF/SusE family outer membrane protein [Saprospirales bacterium]|nr:MAG: SusF/SusE family outer membrane protein [Saprospirales bacterium]